VSLLRVENLSRTHGDRLVLESFNLVLEPGAHTLLLGPSGSGKTTLVNLIAGLDTATAGTIIIQGEPMTGRSAAARDDLRRRAIGMIFQTLRLVGALSVTDNLLLAQRLAGQPRDAAAIAALLDALGVGHRAHARPPALSHGEAQRAAIARALVTRPALLIADEPTSALDDENTGRVGQLLLDLAKAHGSTLLITTHDARLRAFIPDVVSLQPERRAA